MIDFSFWLDYRANDPSEPGAASDPEDVTPLAEQIEVMSVIAEKNINSTGVPRNYAVHPFVSFCPWRQIAEESRRVPKDRQQFALIMDAILRKGFMGVKLYPVMGYLPLGNRNASDRLQYPRRLQALGQDWGERLDDALDRLYGWCIDKDVPIMAHCSFSQYPSEEAGRRGSPTAWEKVLSKYPNLRLNLAHCGGVWDLAPNRSDVFKRAHGRWPEQVVAMLGSGKYPNLYADLADFDGVLGCELRNSGKSMDKNSAVPSLEELVAANPKARDRLMYGTDYMFLIQSTGTGNYVSKMRSCLATRLEMGGDQLMGSNAARFLGLDNPKSQTRQRLDKFRHDSFLARWEPKKGTSSVS
jgi:predicted TIM-barrel fold metal-dependent hydrolase